MAFLDSLQIGNNSVRNRCQLRIVYVCSPMQITTILPISYNNKQLGQTLCLNLDTECNMYRLPSEQEECRTEVMSRER